MPKFLAIICYSFLILALTSCSDSTPTDGKPVENTKSDTTPKPLNVFKNYREQGDLPALRQRGRLRLLVPDWEDTGLPREGLPSHGYRELAEMFAKSVGLEVQWIFTNNHNQLIDKLEQGYGDIIVSHLTQTPEREERIAFSQPVSSAYERIIGPPDKSFDLAEQLDNKVIAVGSGSSFVDSLKTFQENNPEISITVNETGKGDPDLLIDQINAGKIDATVLDSNIAESLSHYRHDFSIGMSITSSRPIAWAVRKSNAELLARLNAFLIEARILQAHSQKYTDDFSAIKDRKTLRIITRNSPTTYFLWRGELMGYEFDLMKKFASRNKLRLEVEVAEPGTDMIQLLKDGYGDVIAANMTITPEREARGIKFSPHYLEIQEQLVSNNNMPPLDSLESLNGRTLTIHPQTSYWQTAVQLLNDGYKFKLVAAENTQTTIDIINAIAQGELDATIADSHLVAIEHKFTETLQPGLKLEPVRTLGWAVREQNTELLQALNRYVNLHYRGQFFNVTYNKYFRNEQRIDKYQGNRLTDSNQLSPYDELIKPAADEYHFDWRMLVSQMYQESKFNPKARSFAGAVGLFQVMPRTARELGYTLPLSEKTGIQAGIQYLDWTRERFEATLPLEERLWFALAAYNAGFGHVNDARRLARQQGLDGDVWFDNVENAMLLLSKRKYYSNARFGYVRGTEPVQYVRDIKNRYYAYLAL